MDERSAAWLAGFIDGDGHIGVHRYWSTDKRYRYTNLLITITQKDRRILDRVVNLSGAGKVYGPYCVDTYPRYVWKVSGNKAYEIIKLIWPLLFQVKRQQAKKAIKDWKINRSIPQTQTSTPRVTLNHKQCTHPRTQNARSKCRRILRPIG